MARPNTAGAPRGVPSGYAGPAGPAFTASDPLNGRGAENFNLPAISCRPAVDLPLASNLHSKACKNKNLTPVPDTAKNAKPMSAPDTEPASAADVTPLLELAMRAHAHQRLDEMEGACRAVLDRDPANADALHLLGVAACARGQCDTALEWLHRASAGAPGSAVILTSIGNAHRGAGRPQQAIQWYERALAADPGYALAYRNLGIVTHERHGAATAIGYYRMAIELEPSHGAIHFNLGNALTELGNLALAVDSYRTALQLDPTITGAWFNLGNALRGLRRFDDAAACYRALLQRIPEHAEAYNHLGQVLAQKRELNQAVDCYRQALRLRPGFAGTHNNLGNALKGLKLPDQAIASYQEAIALKPDFAEAYNNLASVYSEQSRFPEAIAHYERAVELKPDYTGAEANALTLRRQICDWSERNGGLRRLESLVEECLARGEASPVDPFTALSLPFSTATQLAIAQRYAQEKSARVSSLHDRLARPRLAPNPPRLKIGYVSANFRNHPTAHLMVQLFALHDRQRFEIFTYTWGPDDGSDYRRRIAADSDHFVDLTEDSYLASAQRIAGDGIHILVDRAGFTRDSRAEIFALRPAPIQVNYIGFPGSLGGDFIDYLVTDARVSPPEQLQHLAEHPVLLPDCYLVTDPQPRLAERRPSRSECGLPEHGFVFCCFNTNYKIEPTIFDVWMRILARVPGSVLWLLQSSPQAAENLRREAQARGVDSARLVFAPKVPKPEHLARHGLADLFLDTLHYNAHTTAVDSLWSGVPLLTCPGRSFASRVAASALAAVGMEQLVVADLAGYERLAVSLACEPHRYAQVRQALQHQLPGCALFDAERYARHLEAAYEQMWQRYTDGRGPGTIRIGRGGTD